MNRGKTSYLVASPMEVSTRRPMPQPRRTNVSQRSSEGRVMAEFRAKGPEMWGKG